ncbi:MAG: DUF4303 domain-containing protein [Ruminococcaceae bacterium]|nr:DUF4303 domain-containing protein [Oscillospiraceae bacterium]
MNTDSILVEAIQKAAYQAFSKLFSEHREQFYYCSLITTGEGLCPVVSAWSKEALERTAQQWDDVEKAKYYLKWSYAETPYFAFGEEFFAEVGELFRQRMHGLSGDDEIFGEIELRINSMERAMHNLDASGLFGAGKERLGMVINAEFMPPDYTNTERARRLNPEEALTEWLEEAAEE